MTAIMTAQIKFGEKDFACHHFPVIHRTDDSVTVDLQAGIRVMPHTTRSFRITSEGDLMVVPETVQNSPKMPNVCSVDVDTDDAAEMKIDGVAVQNGGVAVDSQDLEYLRTQLLWREKQLLALGHEIDNDTCDETSTYRDQFLCESNAMNRKLSARLKKAISDNERLQNELTAVPALIAEVERLRIETAERRDVIRNMVIVYEARLDDVEGAATDYSGFRFTSPVPSQPVMFFDDTARIAMKELL